MKVTNTHQLLLSGPLHGAFLRAKIRAIIDDVLPCYD